MASLALTFVIEPAQWWIYVLGGGFSLGLLAYVAPSRRDIERRQTEIRAAGSSLSLLSALRAPGAAPRPDDAASPGDGPE